MKRYKVIHGKAAMMVSLASIFFTVLLVFTLGHRSVFIKLEVTLGILALVLFCFFFLGLYMGIRLKNEPFFKEGWKPLKGKWDSLDLFPAGDTVAVEAREGIWGGSSFSSVLDRVLSYSDPAAISDRNMLWGIIFFSPECCIGCFTKHTGTSL
ncbi:hypothetical protein LJK87_09840 [Paenibacillus sp. P25]|nr:hypothetical protein LJK87_09840 [Paenibacillus sp. P25]